MAQAEYTHDTQQPLDLPRIRTIGPADLVEALKRGVSDFKAVPTHVIFLSLIYPVVGLALGRLMFGYDVIPLLFPLAAGFALIGPFAAMGLYELSRRREMELSNSWGHAFDFVRSPSFGAIVYLGLLLVILLGVWLAAADAVYAATLGTYEPTTPEAFAQKVLMTPAGHRLIVIGNAVGFAFALLAFSISAVSFPLLLDRHVGATTAAITSVRLVLKNPGTMALWALIIATGLVVGSLPFFLGLAVVMPILGHATWHLYRAAIEPDPIHQNPPRI